MPYSQAQQIVRHEWATSTLHDEVMEMAMAKSALLRTPRSPATLTGNTSPETPLRGWASCYPAGTTQDRLAQAMMAKFRSCASDVPSVSREPDLN